MVAFVELDDLRRHGCLRDRDGCLESHRLSAGVVRNRDHEGDRPRGRPRLDWEDREQPVALAKQCEDLTVVRDGGEASARRVDGDQKRVPLGDLLRDDIDQGVRLEHCLWFGGTELYNRFRRGLYRRDGVFSASIYRFHAVCGGNVLHLRDRFAGSSAVAAGGGESGQRKQEYKDR